MRSTMIAWIMCAAVCWGIPRKAAAFEITNTPERQNGSVALVGTSKAAIAVDEEDYSVVRLAAGLLSDDIERVSGKRLVVTDKAAAASQMVIAGTLGHSPLVDRLAADGKLKGLERIKGGWETTLCQVVENPVAGVDRAFVVVGSDRRGTAYGLLQLSEKIGVSPWSWWADVPPARRSTLAVTAAVPETDAPAVKYRGIFINDEDWGLHEWAKQTFEPDVGGIGPKTYRRVFELMLRLRLNTIWPAMHAVSREFHSIPENIEVADQYGIVVGASHCEPMLYNNVHWDTKARGPWNYFVNRDVIRSVWEDQAKTRGGKEAVWGLGVRGIHDAGMQGPRDPAARIRTLETVFKDQRDLLDQYVTHEWGPVAQAFVPYKEVLPLYDAGLKVPDNATIVWVDDNFGYIRRLGNPDERKRSGGAGIYWHLSYYGGPHSYTWINTTAPALMWEEFQKAWDNDARTLWVVNVGDIKPMEAGIDFFSKLAWRSPAALGPGAQPQFLKSFAAENFGNELAPRLADFLAEFYRLGTIRKPETMVRSWALSLPEDQAATLRRDYAGLLKHETELAALVPAGTQDAYFQLVGFPARVLGATGRLFMADRAVRLDQDVAANAEEVNRQRAFLEQQVEQFNTGIAGGKWNHVMPGLVTNAKSLMAWNSQVRWPWGEKSDTPAARPAAEPARVWRDADSATYRTVAAASRWVRVPGLGPSAHAMMLTSADANSHPAAADPSATTLQFAFETGGRSDAEAVLEFLPTFRTYPGTQLRVAVGVDDSEPLLVEVPGSDGKEDENGANRKDGVQNNYVRARVPLTRLPAGTHVLRVNGLDPGVILDRVALPAKD